MAHCRTGLKSSSCALAIGLFVFTALTGRGESLDSGQPTAVGNLLVFCTTGSNGVRRLNVVSMEDSTDLKIIGRASIASHKAIHAQSAFEDHIILLLWDEVEVYSVAEPSTPKRVAAFQIRSQRGPMSGCPCIERTADRRFLMISPTGAAELIVDADKKRWSLVDIEMTPDLKQKAQPRSLRRNQPDSRW
jgi:hypothetical protein